MAIPLQHRRGTKAQNDAFTGLIGEVTVDTENKNLRLHDGSTAGGNKIENSTEISARMSGFKNGIINPSFEINQYADIDTAPVAMVNNEHKLDRTRDYILTITGAIQRLSKSLINGKYVNSLKCVATSTGTGIIGNYQSVENLYKGETKTFSIWVKSNNANARIELYDGVSHSVSTPHSGSGLWELLTVTKTISASATLLYAYCSIMASTAGTVPITTGDYIESTMWQLEDGDKATKFEQRPVGLELSLCQRYYEASSQYGSISDTAKDVSGFYFRVEKRVPPTVVFTSTDLVPNAIRASGVTYSGYSAIGIGTGTFYLFNASPTITPQNDMGIIIFTASAEL